MVTFKILNISQKFVLFEKKYKFADSRPRSLKNISLPSHVLSATQLTRDNFLENSPEIPNSD